MIHVCSIVKVIDDLNEVNHVCMVKNILQSVNHFCKPTVGRSFFKELDDHYNILKYRVIRQNHRSRTLLL